MQCYMNNTKETTWWVFATKMVKQMCHNVTVYSKILIVQDEWDWGCFKLPNSSNYDNLEQTITHILVVWFA